jgi:hypothetical protein
MEYDGTSFSLNGHVISYYMMIDDRYSDTYSIKGRVPTLLNGQLVDIIVVFANENPAGMVLGAQKRHNTTTQTRTLAKGLLDIVAGDKIDFLCDYFTYAGKYSYAYLVGKQYTATGTWKIENLSVGDSKYQMTCHIMDIYNNKYWMPSITDQCASREGACVCPDACPLCSHHRSITSQALTGRQVPSTDARSSRMASDRLQHTRDESSRPVALGGLQGWLSYGLLSVKTVTSGGQKNRTGRTLMPSP